MSIRKILIIDDDEEISSLFKFILEKENYIVISASSGQEALSVLDASFDIIIIDIMLPDIRGDQLTQLIREKNLMAGIIFITGFQEYKGNTNLRGLGVSDILIKPIEPQELINSVKEAVENEIFRNTRARNQHYDKRSI